jgi:uncharacterized protein YuzE
MDMSHVAAVFRNDGMNSSKWSNVIGEPMRAEPPVFISQPPRAYYDRKADILSITLQEGEPKYVVVGRGTFVIFADEEGIWSIDLEAESWDSDIDEAFPLMKIEIW